MKELERLIKESKQLYQRRINKRNELKNIVSEKELKTMQYHITQLDSFIKGLEQAKRIIESEIK